MSLRSRRDDVSATRGVWICCLIPVCLFMATIFFAPTLQFLSRSVLDPSPGLGHFRPLFTSPVYLSVTLATARLSAFVTLATVLLGYPVAAFIAARPPRTANRLLLLVLFPLWTSLLVRSYAWMVLLQRTGIVNQVLGDLGLIAAPLPLVYNELGVVIGMTHVLLPFAVLPIYAGMRQVDPALLRAGRSLGAGPLANFFRVFLPLTAPGVAAGALLVFVLAMGYFVIPALLGGRGAITIAMLIERQITMLLNWGFGSALSVLLIASVLLVLGLATWLAGVRLPEVGGRSRPVATGGQVEDADEKPLDGTRWQGGARLEQPVAAPMLRRRPGRARRRWLRCAAGPAWLGIAAGAVYVFLLAPIALVVAMSFSSSQYLRFPPPGLSLQWFRAYFGSAEWIDATLLSLEIAVVTMIAGTVLGTLGAIGLVRVRHWSTRALYGVLLSPMIAPQIITATACYALFVKLRLVGSVVAIAAAHTVLATPFVIVTVSSALAQVDERLEWAARGLGMGPLRAFVSITAPLIMPAIASGAVFAFITSFDEVVIALFLTGTAHPTLPRKMWDAVAMQLDPTLAAVSTIMVAMSVLVLLIGQASRVWFDRYHTAARSDAV